MFSCSSGVNTLQLQKRTKNKERKKKKFKNVLETPVIKGSERTEFEPPTLASSTIPSTIELKEGESKKRFWSIK